MTPVALDGLNDTGINEAITEKRFIKKRR